MNDNQGKNSQTLWRIYRAEILWLAVSDIFRKNRVNVKEKQFMKRNNTYSNNNDKNNSNNKTQKFWWNLINNNTSDANSFNGIVATVEKS